MQAELEFDRRRIGPQQVAVHEHRHVVTGGECLVLSRLLGTNQRPDRAALSPSSTDQIESFRDGERGAASSNEVEHRL